MAILSWGKWYRVSEARVAAWDPDAETWNTGVAVPNLQGVSLTPMMENDEKNVFGAREAFLSVLVGVEASLSFVGKDDASMTEMTGIDSTSSGSGSSETRRTRHAGGADLGMFGLIVAIAKQGGGDMHVLLPYGKLDSLAALEMTEENQFAVPNITAKFGRLRKAAGTLYDVYNELEHATATAVPTDFTTTFADLVIS